VNAVARSVTTLFSAAAQRKAIELKLAVDPALNGWRYGDSLRLRQVLLNLVGNAIKFTQRGRIVVTTRCAVAAEDSAGGERVAFEVSDSGIGIDETQHSRIFEPFVQAQDPVRPGNGGTGLGLAISRDLVRAMGGDLTVDSVLGEGTIFRFSLPLDRAPDASPAAAAPRASRSVGDSRPEELSGRVLLVEDNSVNRLVGTAMLEALGLTVVVAEDGEEALAVLSNTTVDLVLMDCQMPVMDGYEATHRLRELERLTGAPRLPVIALTANALSGDVERCLAAGMDAHLAKPFMIDQLRALIEPWLSAARADVTDTR
jgi:CheY-like chemotaxis protein/anti-sigma regulatory factor (Ser/Thr protein kinase)